MKMKRMMTAWLAATLCLTAGATDVTMTSPDGRYAMTVNDRDGLNYTLQFEGKEVIASSRLGLRWNEEWREGVQIERTAQSDRDTTWIPVYGERSRVRDHYRSWTLELTRTASRQRMGLEVRMYNEGVAFRYLFRGGAYLKIEEEYTEFTMPQGTQAWHTERAQTPYTKMPLKGWSSESDRPLLLELPDQGGYVCLAEAQVVDYVRTKFKLSESKPECIVTSMYGPVEEIAPYHTPWRVIFCGNRPGEILEHNDLLLNLNPPCRIADTGWIRPGKVMREVTLTTAGGKALVDFAVKRNLQYIHFDAGWYGWEYDKASDATTVTLDPRRNPQTDALNLPEVISYAKAHGIGVILYVNQRALQQQLDELLPLYKQWGVAGLKFGFVQVGSQVWTKWMHEAVEKCARYGLMVDIHDEYRPTGFSRTYPNLMTQEGIRGNEEFPDATHNVTLPFTRYVAGAADYTICYYRQDFGRLSQTEDAYGVPRSRTIQTTPAHQLALSVVYYSPLQYMYWYDKPSDAQDEPELKFFDDVYTTWDDTRVLQGAVGEHITVARRHGDEWFVGAITNNEARKVVIDLNFLPQGEKYVAEIYTDGGRSVKTRTHVKVERKRVSASDKLNFELMASGGVAIRLVKEK
ncbi:MAG: glycoside hydrolase family 97 catalytic domain-containing protein [Bacteroides sp.]